MLSIFKSTFQGSIWPYLILIKIHRLFLNELPARGWHLPNSMNWQSGHIGELARSLSFQEFPQHMTWDTSNKKWSAHKDGFALGCMYFVSPTKGEWFYLRTLLTVVKGPWSYDDLLTFNGHHYNLFREACIAQGLLEDDGEWCLCLEEAAQMKTGACW